jgi:cell wall-associated NlpC family hydrolase
VLSDQRAAEIGLPPASGLLLSAPDADLRSLTGLLATVLGSQVQVRPLRPLTTEQAAATNDVAATPTQTPTPTPTPSPSAPLDTALPSAGIGNPAFGPAAPVSSASAANAIEAAKSRIGAPYVYGAAGPDSFDCSGFTSWVFGQVGVALPRTAEEQWISGPHVSYADAQPGDILAWAGDSSAPDYVTHVAIYLGNGQMISAQHTGTTVSITPVYTSGLLGAVRVLS